jgi:hypothetical protein
VKAKELAQTHHENKVEVGKTIAGAVEPFQTCTYIIK